MPERETPQKRDLLSLFSNDEIRGLFKTSLLWVGVLELVILFVSYGHKIATQGPFPWKAYFFAAFTVPLLATFLLVIFVMAFNLCLKGEEDAAGPAPFQKLVDREHKDVLDRMQVFFHVVRRMPFLLGLAVTAAFAGLVYSLGDILAFLTRVGEKTATAVLVSLGVLLAVAAVGGALWLVLQYRLRKRAMDQELQYRLKVAETMKLVILENNTVVDQTGRVLCSGELMRIGRSTGATAGNLLASKPQEERPEESEEEEAERKASATR